MARSRPPDHAGRQPSLDYCGSSDKTQSTATLARFFGPFFPFQFNPPKKTTESSMRCSLDTDDSTLGNRLNMQAQTQRRLQTFEAHAASSSSGRAQNQSDSRLFSACIGAVLAQDKLSCTMYVSTILKHIFFCNRTGSSLPKSRVVFTS